MKNLDNLLEGLLDVDFDISVEPVLYNFKNEKFNFQFGRFLDNYNSIIVSYSVCNQAIDKLKQIVDDLKSTEYQTSFVDNLRQALTHTINGFTGQLSPKDYDIAIEYLEGIRPIVKIAENVEKLLIKMKAPKNVMMAPDPIDRSNEWELCIYQERFVSGQNWIDDNLDKLTSALKKMKNVTNAEYTPERHSIYVQVK